MRADPIILGYSEKDAWAQRKALPFPQEIRDMLRCPDMTNSQEELLAPEGDAMNLFDALDEEIDLEAADDIWYTEQEIRAVEDPIDGLDIDYSESDVTFA